MKEIYNIPDMEIIEFSKDDIVVTSQLENAGSLDWDNVGKPTWGQGNGWQ